MNSNAPGASLLRARCRTPCRRPCTPPRSCTAPPCSRSGAPGGATGSGRQGSRPVRTGTKSATQHYSIYPVPKTHGRHGISMARFPWEESGKGSLPEVFLMEYQFPWDRRESHGAALMLYCIVGSRLSWKSHKKPTSHCRKFPMGHNFPWGPMTKRILQERKVFPMADA